MQISQLLAHESIQAVGGTERWYSFINAKSLVSFGSNYYAPEISVSTDDILKYTVAGLYCVHLYS